MQNRITAISLQSIDTDWACFCYILDKDSAWSTEEEKTQKEAMQSDFSGGFLLITMLIFKVLYHHLSPITMRYNLSHIQIFHILKSLALLILTEDKGLKS